MGDDDDDDDDYMTEHVKVYEARVLKPPILHLMMMHRPMKINPPIRDVTFSEYIFFVSVSYWNAITKPRLKNRNWR